MIHRTTARNPRQWCNKPSSLKSPRPTTTMWSWDHNPSHTINHQRVNDVQWLQITYGGFHKWGYPRIIYFNGMFNDKTSILGFPIYGNTHNITWTLAFFWHKTHGRLRLSLRHFHELLGELKRFEGWLSNGSLVRRWNFMTSWICWKNGKWWHLLVVTGDWLVNRWGTNWPIWSFGDIWMWIHLVNCVPRVGPKASNFAQCQYVITEINPLL